MTREEAKLKIGELGCYARANGWDDDYTQAVNMAIEALEQEPILDKIRAEIENHCSLIKEDHCRYCSYCHSVIGVREILEIIDKYK